MNIFNSFLSTFTRVGTPENSLVHQFFHVFLIEMAMARYGHLRPFKDVYPMFRIWVPGGRIQQDPFQDPTSPHSRWVFSAGDDQTWRPLAQLFPWFLAQLFTLWGWKKSEILHVFCILKQHHVIWIPLWALLVIVGSPTNREEIPMFCESVLVIKLHAL